MNFTDLSLREEITRATNELGFVEPTPVQERVIPHLLSENGDLVALAQTGTGKTAAFGLPVLEKTDIKRKEVQTLVLCPTRELCLQITRDMENFSKYLPGLKITAVYGGAGIDKQIQALRRGTHVVVATPGRLLDLLNRRVADISKIDHLVLDEADIMLNMGFKEELDAILQSAPPERQTVLLSATMPADVARIAKSYMKEPSEITIGEKNAGIETVEHSYFMVHAREKYQALKRIVDFHPDIYGIVFCRTRASTKDIAEKMIKDGYNAEALHGDLSQAQREYVMKKFREGSLQLLIATDIAARGLDVNDLTHIIHFDLPDEDAVYTHRSGRTGRAGKTGNSLAIINMREKHHIRAIEKKLQRKISEKTIPRGKDICAAQLMSLIDRVKRVKVNVEEIAQYLPIIEEKLAALDREELLKHFVSLEFNRFLQYYTKTPDLKTVTSEYKDRRPDLGPKRQDRNRGGSFTPLIINVGKKDRILPPQIIGMINEVTQKRNIKLGKIDIGLSTSRVEIESDYVDRVRYALNGYAYKGRSIKVEQISKRRKRN